jgi:hypothetical protein
MLNSTRRFYNQQAEGQGQTPPAGDGQTPNLNPSTQPAQSDADRNFAELRKQNEKLTKQLAEITNKQVEAEKAKLAEQGNLKELLDLEKAEKAKLLESITNINRQSAVQKELAKAGLSANIADLLLPSIISQVQFDDSGNSSNLQAVIENIKQSTPQLFAPLPATPAGSSGVPATTNPSGSGMTIDEATRIATDPNATEYYAKKAEVDKALGL